MPLDYRERFGHGGRHQDWIWCRIAIVESWSSWRVEHRHQYQSRASIGFWALKPRITGIPLENMSTSIGAYSLMDIWRDDKILECNETGKVMLSQRVGRISTTRRQWLCKL